MFMLHLLDRLSDGIGRIAGWIFFVIGLILTYDVLARFVFLSPTTWAADVSVIFQIWATWLSASYVLRHRHMIRISAFIRFLNPRGRKIVEAFSLILMALFCIPMIWYSTEIVLESIEHGRRSASMIEIPNWIPEISIPLGLSLFLLQIIAELIRLPSCPAPNFNEEEI